VPFEETLYASLPWEGILNRTARRNVSRI